MMDLSKIISRLEGKVSRDMLYKIRQGNRRPSLELLNTMNEVLGCKFDPLEFRPDLPELVKKLATDLAIARKLLRKGLAKRRKKFTCKQSEPPSQS